MLNAQLRFQSGTLRREHEYTMSKVPTLSCTWPCSSKEQKSITFLPSKSWKIHIFVNNLSIPLRQMMHEGWAESEVSLTEHGQPVSTEWKFPHARILHIYSHSARASASQTLKPMKMHSSLQLLAHSGQFPASSRIQLGPMIH